MPDTTPRVSQLPAAKPISRILRALLGAALLTMVVPPVLSAAPGRQIAVLGVFLGLVALYTAVHFAVTRFFGWLHPWLGALVAVMPAVLVFLGGGIYEAGVVLFIGASLVLIAITGQPGCEVLAFPALLLGQRTHLACLLFSPLDWIEGRLSQRAKV